MACCRPKGDCHGLGRCFPVVFHVYRLMVFGGPGFEHKARRRRETLAEIHDEPEVEREGFGSSFLVGVGVQYAFHLGGRVSLLPAIDFDFVNRPREGRDADRLRREDRLQLLMKSLHGTSRLSRDRRDAPQSLSRHPSVQTERTLRRISLGRTSVDYPIERGPVRSRFGKTIQVPRRRLESAPPRGRGGAEGIGASVAARKSPVLPISDIRPSVPVRLCVVKALREHLKAEKARV